MVSMWQMKVRVDNFQTPLQSLQTTTDQISDDLNVTHECVDGLRLKIDQEAEQLKDEIGRLYAATGDMSQTLRDMPHKHNNTKDTTRLEDSETSGGSTLAMVVDIYRGVARMLLYVWRNPYKSFLVCGLLRIIIELI